MLTVLLPVTRAWTLERVVAAIAASDIPRGDLLLIEDAPDMGEWKFALCDLGFNVAATHTGNPAPPQTASPYPRRARHRAMRRLTQTLVPDGRLLCLEDDTLVPADVYRRLSAIGPNATGVQRGRFGGWECGVWRRRWLESGDGVEEIAACGHYCLLTTGEAYRAAEIRDTGSVDAGHTSQLPGLRVDWGCVCGHLIPGGVLWPRGARLDAAGNAARDL